MKFLLTCILVFSTFSSYAHNMPKSDKQLYASKNINNALRKNGPLAGFKLVNKKYDIIWTAWPADCAYRDGDCDTDKMETKLINDGIEYKLSCILTTTESDYPVPPTLSKLHKYTLVLYGCTLSGEGHFNGEKFHTSLDNKTEEWLHKKY